MTQSQSLPKQVSIQERSVLVGEMVVVNGHATKRDALKQRFLRGGYQVQETPHFMLFQRSEKPTTILVHWFSLDELNADIKHYIVYELKPFDLLAHSSDYSTILCGIIGSFFPNEARRAWHEFGAKTVQRFLLFLSTAHTPSMFNFYATIGAFANWYQRVCELCIGETFLDAGCESGFLPLVIAERIPFMKRVVGIDNRPDMFEVMSEIAAERHLDTVHFIQADLLAADFHRLGQFGTVTALGVIEHFAEEEMYQVMTNLLAVTAQRLIITVPYEQELELLYEHKLLFNHERLEALGNWCVQHLNGAARMWCEDCDGGLLLIEKYQS